MLRKVMVFVFAFVLVIALASGAWAKCARGDAKAAVLKAAAILKAKGKAGFADVRKLRYCGKEGYVWINDFKAVMLMHPIKPHLEKKNLAGIKDDKGKKFFVEFITVAKGATTTIKGKKYFTGEGWVGYRWPKPGAKGWFDKCSYVKGIVVGTDNLIVCSGVYASCK